VTTMRDMNWKIYAKPKNNLCEARYAKAHKSELKGNKSKFKRTDANSMKSRADPKKLILFGNQ
jgi:hypothetical protein